MLKKERLIKRIHFIAGTLFGLVLCVMIMSTMTMANAAKLPIDTLGYPIYVNGKMIKLNEALIKDGRTYVQLRELSNQMNVTVDWIDSKYHMLPIPGGNLPDGINLTIPTFIYTDEVTDFYDTTQKITAVEITGIYQKYKTGNNLKYAFGDEGLVVKNEGSEKVIPLKYNPSNGRMYLSIDEFREKVQPYLVDICNQVK
ncbi:stalk domain-containing protein [Gorillibacterium massiliense]|uniref:stalk domain-containing protein n=1 Tax=Gorillibacterium massiliense TaxID=1280390 RepID=UPI0005933E33|nr:stalk domain-containing protein [Gorillibacterium massiliense]